MQPRFAVPLPASSNACRRRAERELARAPRCGCCLSHRVHLAKYVGSTLFLDDDPAALRRALPSAERECWSDQLIAALITLYGRARVSLFTRS